MYELLSKTSKDIISFDNYSDLNNKYSPEHYKKLASILLLKRADLPVLPGFVVTQLDNHTIHFLSGWAESNGSQRLSLRFDSPHAEDHIRLSSLNPSIEELKKVADIISPPIIGLVLAENDRYKQGHSVLILFLDDRMYCDIVGPGFDAGDITRGNVTPHETIEIIHKKESEFNGELSAIDILKHSIVSPENYTKSCKHRFEVIFSSLDKGLGKSVLPQKINAHQEEKVYEFLFRRGATIPTSYQPLEWRSILKFYSRIAPLDSFREYYKSSFGIDIRGKVLSASFLSKYGLIFWDFYDGSKYKRQ